LALPPLKDGDGISDYDQLVGDYTNPILQPWAAEVVKKFGEMSLAGITYGNPSNQCWPEPPPFIYKQALVLILQQPDTITMVYSGNMDVRRVRMNQPHKDTPALYGDSVGHYEGDTLVIDTIGIRTDRPYAMIDLFGTPYTKALHLVERYRLRDYDDVKDAIERNKKENWLFAGDVFSGHRGKFLQLELTIEDKGYSRRRGPRRLLTYRGPARGQRLSVLKTPINIITTAATPTFRALISRTSEG